MNYTMCRIELDPDLREIRVGQEHVNDEVRLSGLSADVRKGS